MVHYDSVAAITGSLSGEPLRGTAGATGLIVGPDRMYIYVYTCMYIYMYIFLILFLYFYFIISYFLVYRFSAGSVLEGMRRTPVRNRV